MAAAGGKGQRQARAPQQKHAEQFAKTRAPEKPSLIGQGPRLEAAEKKHQRLGTATRRGWGQRG